MFIIIIIIIDNADFVQALGFQAGLTKADKAGWSLVADVAGRMPFLSHVYLKLHCVIFWRINSRNPRLQYLHNTQPSIQPVVPHMKIYTFQKLKTSATLMVILLNNRFN